MKKHIIQHGLSALLLALTFSLGVSLSVFAHDGSEDGDSSTTQTQTSEQKKEEALRLQREKAAASRTEQQTAVKNRLSDAKKKVCETRKEVITKLMTKNSENAQKHFDQVTTIFERVQEFYAKKGKTVANYDELVAIVNEKKAAAQTAVDSLSSSSTNFDCNGDNPKGSINTFRTHLTGKTTALKEYRTAVKNLIVAVKSAQGTASAEKEQQ